MKEDKHQEPDVASAVAQPPQLDHAVAGEFPLSAGFKVSSGTPSVRLTSAIGPPEIKAVTKDAARRSRSKVRGSKYERRKPALWRLLLRWRRSAAEVDAPSYDRSCTMFLPVVLEAGRSVLLVIPARVFSG